MASKHRIDSGFDDLPIAVDRKSFVPYYEQIIAQLRNAIKTNKLRAGEVFWSERELAEKVGISKLPAKRAYERLSAEGLLVTTRGKRPVIGTGTGGNLWNVQGLWSFSEEVRRRGLSSTTQLLSINLLNPDQEVASALQLHPADQVYAVKRLRFVEGEPVALETAQLPGKLFPSLETQDLERQSLYCIIEGVYGRSLERGEERTSAVPAEPEEAHLLRVGVGFPLMKVQRVAYDVSGTPVECGLSLFRADHYVARIISLRRPAVGSSTETFQISKPEQSISVNRRLKEIERSQESEMPGASRPAQ
jgi:GntR family transcriptional regulator